MREALVLELWEQAVGRDRWQRDEVLLRTAGEPPPRRLGARNLALLARRNALFGSAWQLTSICPACGTACEFSVDSRRLAEELAAPPAREETRFEWRGHPLVVRPPTVEDLLAASLQPDAASAARTIAERCIPAACDLSECDDDALAELNRHLEQLDPAALVAFTVACPDCAHEWSAAIDVGETLWTEVRHAAERSLIEIATLARSYGWTEEAVMRLSPMRRAAYMQLATGT